MINDLRRKLEFTRSFFNKPRPPDQAMSPVQAYVFRAVVDLIPKGNGRDLALDLGCHWGRYTQVLARTYGSVVGVDFAPEALRSAPGAPNIRYVGFDLNTQAAQLSMFGEVDLFLAVALFEMVADPAQLCRALWAANKTGGRVLALIPNRASINYLSLRTYLWLTRSLGHRNRYIYNNGIDARSLHGHLKAAGYRIEAAGEIVGAPVYLVDRMPPSWQRRALAREAQLRKLLGGSYHWVLARK